MQPLDFLLENVLTWGVSLYNLNACAACDMIRYSYFLSEKFHYTLENRRDDVPYLLLETCLKISRSSGTAKPGEQESLFSTGAMKSTKE